MTPFKGQPIRTETTHVAVEIDGQTYVVVSTVLEYAPIGAHAYPQVHSFVCGASAVGIETVERRRWGGIYPATYDQPYLQPVGGPLLTGYATFAYAKVMIVAARTMAHMCARLSP